MSFKGAKKKLHGCLREVSKVFQGCFKEVLRVFQGRLGEFLESFKGDSMHRCYIRQVWSSPAFDMS